MTKVTFAICEKSFLIRKGLVSVIDKIPDTQLVQQIENEEEFLAFTNNSEIDYVIINKTFLKNIALKEAIKQLSENSGIIVLTDNSSDKFTEIIHRGIIYLNDSQSIILKNIKEITGSNTVNGKSGIPEEISKREADILKNIALGYSNKEIAEKLFISTHTVVTHRKNITRKLGIKTVPGLTIYAIINKLIDINETGKLNPDTHK
ncbi:MAG: response regulator transcription factor [Bacteroidales bacterium]|nr:response regulator transcription factor [Bacteroidales bacterium]